MAAPYVTGIVRTDRVQFESNPFGGYVAFSDYAIGSKQAKPVDANLPYHRRVCKLKWQTNWGQERLNATDEQYAPLDFPASRTLARNKAYEGLKDKLLNSAQIGASIAEYNQASEMITARGKQLLTFARHLRRLDIISATKSLSLDPRRRVSLRDNFGTVKSFGNLFLEYHFGWEPLAKDIVDGCVVLAKPAKKLWAKSSGSAPFNFYEHSEFYGTSPVRSDIVNRRRNGNWQSLMMASCVIDNPNVAVNAQLGLLNPASIAWELVPFSFVADWFGNVGQVLSSMTDFMGCTISSPYHTDTARWTVDFSRDYNEVGWGYLFGRTTGAGMYMDRSGGLISPELVLTPIHVPSIIRAATQISLLAQFLGNSKR